VLERATAPRVTVITPAYNSAAYLAETIASVLSQTFRDLELIVIDDGSTDDTTAVARRFARRDQRVRIFEQPNRGAAAARNVALREGRGEFYALIDSDDVWMPHFLSDQLAILSARPDLAIVSANAINIGGPFDGRPLKPASDEWLPVSLLDVIEQDDAVCVMSVFRRDVVDRIGGFDINAHNNEDYDFWIRAACAGCGIAFNCRPACYYRRRPDSKSANEERMRTGHIRVLESIRPLCADRSTELAAIDRKIRSLDRRRLIVVLKRAILERDFASAANACERLRDEYGDRSYRILAHIARHAPQLLLWLYAAKVGGRKVLDRVRVGRLLALRA